MRLGKFMKIALGFLALFLLSGCSSKCDDGCLVVNGEKLPFSDAETLLLQCDNFRTSPLSFDAINLSFNEISNRTNNNPNAPLMSAHMDYVFISESPLVFDRKNENNFLKHKQIRQACLQLRHDFNGDRYWVN